MNIPPDLATLLQAMATDFPTILRGNLVGIYLWGSLTYDAFDKTCSDVDCVAVTERDLDDREFAEVDQWFKNEAKRNRWVGRLDMRFVVDREQLDKSSRCCGFHHHTGKLIGFGAELVESGCTALRSSLEALAIGIVRRRHAGRLKNGSTVACRRPHRPTNYCAAAADLVCGAGSKRVSFASRSARALRRIC